MTAVFRPREEYLLYLRTDGTQWAAYAYVGSVKVETDLCSSVEEAGAAGVLAVSVELRKQGGRP